MNRTRAAAIAAAAASTARPLLLLFASYAVGGAPREDAPVRTHNPARIF